MNNEIASNRKRCKWCEWSEHNPFRRKGEGLHRCTHSKNYGGRAIFWPKTGCPGFLRAPGADDDCNFDRKGMFA